MLAPSAKRREVFGEPHKGELHPSKNRSYDGLRHLGSTFLPVDDSANELLGFLVWPLQRHQWVLLHNCLVGALPYSHYVTRSFPLCGVRVLHSAHHYLTRRGRFAGAMTEGGGEITSP